MKGTGIREQGTGLLLVKKPVGRVCGVGAVGLRDGSTGMVVVPRMWAVGEALAPEVRPLELASAVGGVPLRPRPELAFYRKYTEALLRRYLKMSMANGRVPSLLGRELFSGNVTNYTVSGFDEAIIFCIDVEKCMGKLQGMELALVKRIGVQEYSQGEAAGILGLSLRDVVRKYAHAIDRLTGILLAAGMLESLKGLVREEGISADA